METKHLSNREYYALREIFGIENSFSRCAGELKNRAEMIPDCWMKINLIIKLADEVINDLLKTIEPKKLLAIRKELDNTICEVKVVYNFAKTDDREFVYIPAKAVDRLVNRVMNNECLICDKNAKQAKKCPICEDFDDCYPWKIKPKGDECAYAGYFALED